MSAAICGRSVNPGFRFRSSGLRMQPGQVEIMSDDEEEFILKIYHKGVVSRAPVRGRRRFLLERSFLDDIMDQEFGGTRDKTRPIGDPSRDFFEVNDEQFDAYPAVRQMGWPDQAHVQLYSKRRPQPHPGIRENAAWDGALGWPVHSIFPSLEGGQGIHGDRWWTNRQHRMDRHPRPAARGLSRAQAAINATTGRSATVIG